MKQKTIFLFQKFPFLDILKIAKIFLTPPFLNNTTLNETFQYSRVGRQERFYKQGLNYVRNTYN